MLADAERSQFEQGASDLVVVNLRELAAAEAERVHVQALSTYQQTLVDYVYATGAGW